MKIQHDVLSGPTLPSGGSFLLLHPPSIFLQEAVGDAASSVWKKRFYLWYYAPGKDEVQFGDEKQTQEGAAEPSLLLFHSESLNSF